MDTRRLRVTNGFLIISAFTLCVVLPFIKLGIPSGHDFEFHFNSWIEVAEHWRQGTFYPHWAALAHFGYGGARFVFYPPFSWTLGALLGIVLPWKFVPAAYIWIVLTLAGWSMFLLARKWFSYRSAIFVALLYATNPYTLVIVYWRSALAELMAAIYLPLLLLLILRLEKNARWTLVPLSLLLAAGWLTNVPSAVMMTYSIAILAVVIAFRRRSFSLLATMAAAVLLGAMLAGFYLVPVFHEQSWVNISQVLAPGVRPVDNFLFTNTTDADHNLFNLLISIVAVFQIALLGLALWGSRRGLIVARLQKKDARSPLQTTNDEPPTTLFSLLLVWSIVCALLMVRPTLPFWLYLPELRFVQLPWRWLLCLNVPFALAITFGVRRWWLRAIVCAAALATFLVVWHRVQVPWWDNAGDIQEMLDNQQDGTGNEGVDEYVPATADSYDINHNAPLVRFEGNAAVRINVQQWLAERRRFLVNSSAPGNLVVRLFNYPSWKVRVNGRLAKTGTTARTGQMTIAITAGQSQIEIDFVQGRDRMVGMLCSAVAFIVLLICLIVFHRRPAFLARSSSLIARTS
ncbi:MAG TPA: 6-pyruvoyl-tetrahydropterin synthase-related protein [Terriglobales bacterium]|nr:6-pyruvoyl-tetrahydropterin synthase-related protein [Terriglobales bacterium]